MASLLTPSAVRSPLETGLVGRLRSLCGPRHVLTEPEELLAYDSDGLTLYHHLPDAVVIPGSAEEVRQVLELLRVHHMPCVLRGGGTSLSGGPVAVQGGVVVHLSRLRKIVRIDPMDLYCEVEAGVILADLNRELARHGLMYPPDPSSAPSCTLGGTVAENAGGAHCFKYGVTSHYVLGLEVILADGTPRRFGGPAGGWRGDLCDWRALMVGSEGLLGAFTKFWLRLVPQPGKVWTLRCAFPSIKAALECVLDVVRHPSIPAAVEFMDSRSVNMIEESPARVGLRRDACVIIVEVDAPEVLAEGFAREMETIMQRHGALDLLTTDAPEDRARLWKARKGAGGLLGQISPDLMVQDAVLPRTRLVEFLEAVYRDADAVQIPVVCFFHAGDGNVHPNYLFDSRNAAELEKVESLGARAMQRAVDLGGVLSGEHGIGMDKMKYMKMLFSPEEMAMQRGVTAAFNADHRLNPGKVLEGRTFLSRTNGVHA